MFKTHYNGSTWSVLFEEKVLVDGLKESQAMTLWNNLDELLEEFLSLDEATELIDD